MIIFLLVLILAVLFLGSGGIAALFMFAGFCLALIVTWACLGAYACAALAAIGFFMWVK